MKSFLRAKETLGRYKRSWLVPDVIWLFPVMWKNGVGLKHKGKEEKGWKMQNEQNKKRISMIWKYSRIKKENIYCTQSKTYLEHTSGVTNAILPTHIYSLWYGLLFHLNFWEPKELPSYCSIINAPDSCPDALRKLVYNKVYYLPTDRHTF